MDQENKLTNINNPLTQTDLINLKMFDWIYNSLVSEGGDGDIVVGFTHQNYKAVADLFEEWIKCNSRFPFNRNNKGTYVEFVDNQEYIIFTNKENFNLIENYGPRILTW